jgi:hypothetical protein
MPKEQRLIAISVPVAIQAGEGDGPSKGPSKFDVTAYTGGMLNLDNFDRPVVVDLASMQESKSLVANLDHERTQRVGHVTAKVNDGSMLCLAGLASAATPARDEVVNSALSGFNWQASIEAHPGKLEAINAGKSVTVNGQSFDGPIYVARGSRLNGFAFVSHGADDDTTVKIAAAAASTLHKDKKMEPDVLEFIEACGLDVELLSAEQKDKIIANYKGRNPPAKPAKADIGGRTVDEIVQAQKAENDRQQKITEIMARQVDDNPKHLEQLEAMARRAIVEKHSVERFELDVLRATRPQSHTVFTPPAENNRLSAKVIEAAVCRSGKLINVEKHYDAQTLEACDKHFRDGIGLQELILLAARENGCRSISVRSNLREVMQAAFGGEGRQIRAEGFSTISLPTTFANIANKFLMEGWMAVDPTWKSIASTVPVNDFKTRTSFSLTGGFEYKLVPPSGEITHATTGEVVYTNKADTYARMFAVNRTDIINDDLGALTSVPRRLGRGAALSLNTIFWGIFLNNSAFFTSGHSNVSTGGGSALALAGLQTAEQKFLDQTDPDGNPLGILPAILLVPTALKATALTLMNSEFVVSGITTAGGLPSKNVFAGRYSVECSPYMSNASFTGNSSAAWYLLSRPTELSTIEVCFLNGRESPIVETAEADFSTLGISMRGYHDWGVALQEYRAGVRSAGS